MLSFQISSTPSTPGVFLVAQTGKNLPVVQETWVPSWVREIPWRREWLPTAVSLPGESPWTEDPGRLQSTGLQLHTTEQLTLAFSDFPLMQSEVPVTLLWFLWTHITDFFFLSSVSSPILEYYILVKNYLVYLVHWSSAWPSSLPVT